MSRKILVATTAFGPSTSASLQQNLGLADSLLETAGRSQADVVCLPETFPGSNMSWTESFAVAETVPGPIFDQLAKKARQYSMYVVAGLLERRAGDLYNTAVLIDRHGQLVGQYDKLHPILGEMDRGVVPGEQVELFETDFGRVGIAICFDIGWPELWDELGARSAEIVFWPSAYDGGFPLQTYAWRNLYYVVSSVSTFHARIIDVTGQPLASTSRHTHLVTREVDLDKQVFHIDYHGSKLRDLMASLGREVTVQAFSEEAIFTLESNRSDRSVADIADAWALERFRDYHRRLGEVQSRAQLVRAKAALTSVGGTPTLR